MFSKKSGLIVWSRLWSLSMLTCVLEIYMCGYHWVLRYLSIYFIPCAFGISQFSMIKAYTDTWLLQLEKKTLKKREISDFTIRKLFMLSQGNLLNDHLRILEVAIPSTAQILTLITLSANGGYWQSDTEHKKPNKKSNWITMNKSNSERMSRALNGPLWQ